MSRPRLHFLDLLRGLLFLNMVAYHFLFDWVYIFGQSCPFFLTHAAYLWQQAVCSGFILLAGCCCTLSRRPARRGLQIFGCALLVTVVTAIVTPDERIVFGILHFIGLAYLLTALLAPLLKKIPAGALAVASLGLFALTKGVYYGYLGFFDHAIWTLPDALYQSPALFALGFPGPGFLSGDYFPLIPWLFLFWLGYSAGPLLLRSRGFLRVQGWRLPALNWIGQHTLPLYLLHQPLIYGALTLLFR